MTFSENGCPLFGIMLRRLSGANKNPAGEADRA